jgi:hypothetical protein
MQTRDGALLARLAACALAEKKYSERRVPFFLRGFYGLSVRFDVSAI